MKIATTTGDFYSYTQDINKCIDYLFECGFKYLDFCFTDNILKVNGLCGDDYKQNLDKIIEKCNALGVKFVQSHAPMGAPIIKDENHEHYMFILKRSIECASYLGIENIVVHSGHQQNVLKEESFKKNKEFYLSILDFAEELGVKILTENFNKMAYPDTWFWTDNVYDVIELVEYINHPNLAVCYDIGHANMQKTPQHEQIIHLGKYLKAVHVQDNNGYLDYHVAPFFGTTNFDSVMHGLKEIGFNGYFTLEASNFYTGDYFKTKFGENKLYTLPIEFKIKGQKLLYELTKHILVTYDCFSE